MNKLQRKRDDLNDERSVKHAYEKLITLADEERLFVYDLSTITTMDDIENQIINIGAKNLVVFIDGLYNLQSDNKKDGIRVENIERAQGVKALVDVYQVPIICTGELRKKPAEAKKVKTTNNSRYYGNRKVRLQCKCRLAVIDLFGKEGMADKELKLILNYSKNKLIAL